MDAFIQTQVTHMSQAISELQLWDWLANFEPERGFVWSDDPNVNAIATHPLVVEDGHTGCSFALYLRHMQKIGRS